MADDEDLENEENEENEESLDEPKKGMSKLILFGAPLVILLAVGAGLYFTGMLDGLLGKSADTEEHAEGEHGDDHAAPKASKDSHGEEGASGPYFMEVKDIIVNLSSTGPQPRFLKLKVQLEVDSASDLAAVEAVAPRVIDHFQTYLRELRVEDLKGSAGIYRLRQELIRRVNAAAYPVEVKDVLFQEILIQ